MKSTRRDFVKMAGLGVSGMMACPSLLAHTPAKTKKPNLLFIMTDQQRWDALSIAGNTVLQTPTLDRLARHGAFFKHAYTPCAVCCPARSVVLTGHTVENTGMTRNDYAYTPEQDGLMTQPTFDEILTEQGYRCEYYGKWHSLSARAECYQNPVQTARNGLSIFGPGGQTYMYRDYLNQHVPRRELKIGEFYENISQRPYRTDPIDRYHGMSPAELEAKDIGVVQPDQHGELLMSSRHSITAFQARQTIEAIERLKDQPFSITCSFHFPHSPMTPTRPYYGMYPPEAIDPPASIHDDMSNSPYAGTNGRRHLSEYRDKDKIRYMISNYYGLVKEIDDWVGEILQTLDKHGLTENTMVIFTSDHGEMLGAHGMREKNVFYEESAHVPLLVRFPSRIKSNTVVEAPVSLIDLFATILDYMGVEKHPSDGESLRGLIEGTDGVQGRYAVAEWLWRGDTESNYMIVKDGWKMMIPCTETSTVLNALYDLNTDPYEMNNLIGSNPNKSHYAEKTEELRRCLLEWLHKTGSKHVEGISRRKLV